MRMWQGLLQRHAANLSTQVQTHGYLGQPQRRPEWEDAAPLPLPPVDAKQGARETRAFRSCKTHVFGGIHLCVFFAVADMQRTTSACVCVLCVSLVDFPTA